MVTEKKNLPELGEGQEGGKPGWGVLPDLQQFCPPDGLPKPKSAA